MTICNSRDLCEAARPLFNVWVEELWVFSLSNHLEILRTELVFRGDANSCPAHPREIIKSVILSHATQFVLVHNHPSGSAAPSKQDRAFTKKMLGVSALLSIPLIDHIILGANDYYSFADSGNLKSVSLRYHCT